MIAATNVILGILVVAAALMLGRAVRGPTTAERIVALDAILVTIACGLAVLAARTGDPVFLDLAVVAALLGFAGTVTVARFIERRGS